MKKLNFLDLKKANGGDNEAKSLAKEVLSPASLKKLRGGTIKTNLQSSCDAVCLPPGYSYCSCYTNLA